MSEIRNIKEGEKINAKKNRGNSANIDFEFGSSTFFRILLVFAAVLVVVFCVYQVARTRAHQKMLHTQTALNRTVNRTITTEGFVLREESVIPYRGSGAVVPVAENGSKVAVGDTVAKSYASADAAVNSVKYAELEELQRYYNEIQSFAGNTVSVGMELYDQAIIAQLAQFEGILEHGSLASLPAQTKALGREITKKQIAVGKQVNVGAEVASLSGQMEALAASLNNCTQISAEKSGFYMNETDGYEAVGEYDSVLKITPTGVRQLLNTKPAAVSSAVGKLITQFNWYLVCDVSREEAKDLKNGSTVRVSFIDCGSTVDMTIKAINPDKEDRVALVLVSDRVDAQLAKLRIEKVKIRTKEYTGYAVDKAAVRTVDGTLGVYIQLGNIIRFRKIEVIYSDDSVVLVSNKEESGYLRLYDEIIVEGTDLSDGKIID